MQANPYATRFSSVLAATGILFCVYYFLIVPHLEAPLPRSQALSSHESTVKSRSPYARFFSEDSWERTTDSENLLKSDNIVMLFQNFRINEEMKISSDKCTILIAPGEKAFPTKEIPGKPFHPVIISIVEGADIQLASNEEENFSPHPVEGRLHGPVTIKHKAKIRNQYLDCSLVTSDLICDMNTLQTQKPVQFAFGPLVGEGSHLNVLFEVGEEKKSPFSGIQSIRLNHLKHISLYLTPIILQQICLQDPNDKRQNARKLQAIRKMIDSKFGRKMLIPVTLTCDGPLVYDVSSGSISFSENVAIRCQYENSPHDTLVCKDLTIQLSPEIRNHFRENPQTDSVALSESQTSLPSEMSSARRTMKSSMPETNENDPIEIPLESVSAKTNVRLDVPSFNCSAQADLLEFHFPTQTLRLESNQQAEICFTQQNFHLSNQLVPLERNPRLPSRLRHEFHAQNIAYVLPYSDDQKSNSPQSPNDLRQSDDPQLGTLQVNGSGWFGAFWENSKDRSLLLRMDWRERMTSQKLPNARYGLEVAGKVKIESPQWGDLTADLLQLSLRPKTKRDETLEQNIVRELQKFDPKIQGAQRSQDSLRSKKNDYLPETLTASGNVCLNLQPEFQKTGYLPELPTTSENVGQKRRSDSVQLCAELERIRINFQSATKYPDALFQDLRNAQTASTSQQTPSLLTPTPAISDPVADNSMPNSSRKFNLNAESLVGEILLLPGKTSFFISQATLLGKTGQNLVLYENSPYLTSDQAIRAEAQKIVLHDIHRASLQGVVQGSPAVLSGMGIRLETVALSLNCAANRIDVNQPGKMNVYFRKKQILSETAISWQKNLFFDGKKIQANGNVQIKENATAIFTERVQALLCEPIQLNNPPKFPKSSEALGFFSNLSAEKNIFIQHKLFNKDNALTDVFSIRSNYLYFDPVAKTIAADGKGELRLSHFGVPGKKERTVPQAFLSQPESRPKEEWRQILLEYSGGIRANLADGEFSINQNIVGITYPVPNEKYLIPKVRMDSLEIPPMGFSFTCSKIFINQIPSIPETASPQSGRTKEKKEMKLEFLAEGNLHLEDSMHSIDGHILKYSQEKNSCSISGTPQTPVRITRQEFVGGPRNEMQAGNININLDSMKFSSDEIMLEGAF